jgi:hypothetical protein
MKESCYIYGGSADYGPKSSCRLEWNPFEIAAQEEEAPEVSIEIINVWGPG